MVFGGNGSGSKSPEPIRIKAKRAVERSWKSAANITLEAFHEGAHRPDLCVGIGNCVAIAPSVFSWIIRIGRNKEQHWQPKIK